jgi:hypothetical protein
LTNAVGAGELGNPLAAFVKQMARGLTDEEIRIVEDATKT